MPLLMTHPDTLAPSSPPAAGDDLTRLVFAALEHFDAAETRRTEGARLRGERRRAGPEAAAQEADRARRQFLDAMDVALGQVRRRSLLVA